MVCLRVCVIVSFVCMWLRVSSLIDFVMLFGVCLLLLFCLYDVVWLGALCAFALCLCACCSAVCLWFVCGLCDVVWLLCCLLLCCACVVCVTCCVMLHELCVCLLCLCVFVCVSMCLCVSGLEFTV